MSQIAIPEELLTDLVQVCLWLEIATSDRHVPPSVIELWHSQAGLVKAWLEEYAPTTAATAQMEGDS